MSLIVIAKYVVISLVNVILATYITRSRARLAKAALLPIFLFAMILIHSIAVSTDTTKSIERVLFAYLFIFAATVTVARFPSWADQVFGKFLFVSCIGWVIACLAAMIIYPAGSYHAGNFRGFTNNSNYLALYLSVFLAPYLLTNVCRTRWRNSFWILNIFLFILIAFLIFQTRSRASLLVLVFAALIQLKFSRFFREGSAAFKTFAIPLLASVLLLSLLSIDFVVDKYSMGNDTLIESIFSTRAKMYEYRIQGITERPWLGWGYSVNSMEGRMIEPWVFNDFEKGTTPLALVEEFGIIVGVPFILLLGYVGVHAIRTWQAQPTINSIVLLSLTHSLFETWLFNFNSYYCWIFWFSVIRCLAVVNVNRREGRVAGFKK